MKSTSSCRANASTTRPRLKRIAILGAECTGKTQLTQALHAILSERHGRVHWVPEVLRDWCETHQRTPQRDEQAAVARAQMQRTGQAPPCDLLLADTTALMTAIYSDVLFDDPTLYPEALAHHRRYDLTLVMGLDLPWVADGLQRDGPQARQKINARLREVLHTHQLGYAVIYGVGDTRTQGALQAIEADTPLLAPASSARQAPWQWHCDHCSDAPCEHALFTGRLQLGQAGITTPRQGPAP